MLVTDRTFAERAERASRAESLTLDIESTGLSPWKGDRAVGVAVEIDGEADYFPFRHEAGGNLSDGSLSKLLQALRGKRYRGWNLRYDLTMLSFEAGGDWCLAPGVDVEDGIIDALLLNENEPSFSLFSVAEKYLGSGAAGSKAEMGVLLAERFSKIRSERQRKGNLWRLHASEVADYACGDVLLPRALRDKYAPMIERWELTALAREMNAYNLLLARMQKAGIAIDVERCGKLSLTTEERKARLLAQLRETAGPTFNPNSWQQVTKLTGAPDAKEATLEGWDHPIARGTIDYKKLGKAKSTYYDVILDLVDSAGVLHPQLNLTRDPTDSYGARTGRLSCSHPNFQALPHPDADPNAIYKVRDLVVPRPGYKLAKLDYERAEMWMGASYCRSKALIDAYHQGRDIYAEMAKHLNVTRHAAKILFLMIQYGAGVWKIEEAMRWGGGPTEWFGPAETYVTAGYRRAWDVRQRFFEMYPEIRRAMRAYADAWEGTGSLRLWTGRVCHYPGDRPYAGWNRVVQGAVAEMIRCAMQTLEPLLAALGARMLLQVHDELLVEYPAGAEHEVVRLCSLVMTNFDQFLLRPRVEPKVSGTNYAEMANYTEGV
ncbi:MAG: DNA polymerase [Egibacteraceae bacterium]